LLVSFVIMDFYFTSTYASAALYIYIYIYIYGTLHNKDYTGIPNSVIIFFVPSFSTDRMLNLREELMRESKITRPSQASSSNGQDWKT